MALKRYRLKIYDGTYEVLHKNRYHVDVDLDSAAANAILDRQLVALIELGRIANEPMDHPVMKICDYSTGQPIQDWVS